MRTGAATMKANSGGRPGAGEGAGAPEPVTPAPAGPPRPKRRQAAYEHIAQGGPGGTHATVPEARGDAVPEARTAGGEPAADRGGWIRPGTLYVCATPIGNLGDVTFRLLEVLRRADRVLAEDTRRARRLLAAYGIAARVVSCHEYNEVERAEEVAGWLAREEVVALLTDAGTPGVADPGARLVARIAAAGWPVVPVPGPSAALAALSVAGIPAARVLFEGFLPRAAARRRQRMASWRAWEGAVVFFEAPHRLHKVLADLLDLLPDGYLVVARELTKQHEEIRRGLVARLVPELLRVAPRGEYTLVLAPPAAPRPALDGEEPGVAAAPRPSPEADAAGSVPVSEAAVTGVALPGVQRPAATTGGRLGEDAPGPRNGHGARRAGGAMPSDQALAAAIATEVAAGLAPSEAARRVARRYGVSRNRAYRAYLNHAGNAEARD